MALFAGTAGAAEPVRQFVEAACQAGHYDQALAYLAGLETSSLVDDTVKASLPYERGVVLLRSALASVDFDAKRHRLERAGQVLRAFVESRPESVNHSAARNRLARILVEEARLALAAAGEDQAKVAAASADAKDRFQQAQKAFQDNARRCQSQFDAIPRLAASESSELATRRRKLQSDLVDAEMADAEMDFEIAGCLPAGTPPDRARLDRAAQKFSEIHRRYRKLLVGLRATVWEGRCYQALGNLRKAVGRFEEIIELENQEGHPDVELLQAKAVDLAMQCRTDVRLAKYDQAIELGERWLAETERNGRLARQRQAIRYRTDLAYHAAAEAEQQQGSRRRRYRDASRRHGELAAGAPGPHQRSARILLASLGVAGEEPTLREPESFAQARRWAVEARQRMRVAATGLEIARKSGDPEHIETFEQQYEAQRQRAFAYLRWALRLTDASVASEDLIEVRGELCRHFFEVGDLYEAIVLGEALARHASQTTAGRDGVMVALAAYGKLYNDGNASLRKFAGRQIEALADLIARQWPGEEVDRHATTMLLRLAINDGDIDRAEELLRKIPTDAAHRPALERIAGQAFWAEYQRRRRGSSSVRAADPGLAAIRERARELLETGIEPLRADGVARLAAREVRSVLALAQLYVESQQVEQATKLLQDPSIGPLTLVEGKAGTTVGQSLRVEIYKTALQALMTADPPRMAEAKSKFEQLERMLAGKGDAAAQLTALYMDFGRLLQQRLKTLREAGQTDAVAATSAQLAEVLDRVAGQKASPDAAMRRWLAGAYYHLAKADQRPRGALTTQAKAHYEQALELYVELLQSADAAPEIFAGSTLALRVRVAECHRCLGQFDLAIGLLKQVLALKPNHLAVQVEAAQTLQDMGASDPRGYVHALKGAEPGPTGKMIVWGWEKIANLTSGKPQFEPIFFEARLNMAEARFKYGLRQKDAVQRGKILQVAKRDIRMAYHWHPKLGGEAFTRRFEQLLKKIQSSLRQEPRGLSEFAKSGSAAASR